MLDVIKTKSYEQMIENSNQVTIINLVDQPFQESNMFRRFSRLRYSELWRVTQGKMVGPHEIPNIGTIQDDITKNVFTYSFGGAILEEERIMRTGIVNTDELISIVNYVDSFTKKQYEKTNIVWFHISVDYIVSAKIKPT